MEEIPTQNRNTNHYTIMCFIIVSFEVTFLRNVFSHCLKSAFNIFSSYPNFTLLYLKINVEATAQKIVALR